MLKAQILVIQLSIFLNKPIFLFEKVEIEWT